jgi:hypothetical protein
MIVSLRAWGVFQSFQTWLPAASCGGKIWLSAASCSGKIWLSSARCIRESHLSAAKCIGDLTPRCNMQQQNVTLRYIMQQRDLTPCCMMQWRDLAPRYIMQQRDLIPAAWRSGESNFNCNNSTKLTPKLTKTWDKNQCPRQELFMKKNGGGKSRATVPLG